MEDAVTYVQWWTVYEFARVILDSRQILTALLA